MIVDAQELAPLTGTVIIGHYTRTFTEVRELGSTWASLTCVPGRRLRVRLRLAASALPTEESCQLVSLEDAHVHEHDADPEAPVSGLPIRYFPAQLKATRLAVAILKFEDERSPGFISRYGNSKRGAS